MGDSGHIHRIAQPILKQYTETRGVEMVKRQEKEVLEVEFSICYKIHVTK